MTNGEIPRRPYAGIFDLPIGSSETRGCCPNPDAITGCDGISWESYFKDSQTGQTYQVFCYDGVNGGRGPYLQNDDCYRNACYQTIVDRCHRQAKAGVQTISISKNERRLMQSFIHQFWLETAEGKRDGKQSEDGLDGGFIGHVWGIPLYCNVDQEDNLPPRQ